MIRLFYVSSAAESVDSDTISNIAENSTKKNVALGITGALAFNGTAFGQILEGEEDKVLELLETLKADDRHSGLVEVSRIDIKTRAFYDWGMMQMETSTFESLVEIMNA